MVLCVVFVGEYGRLYCAVQKMNGRSIVWSVGRSVTKLFRSAVSSANCRMLPACHLACLYRSTSGAGVSFKTVSGGWYTCSDYRLDVSEEQSAFFRMVIALLLFDAEVTLGNEVWRLSVTV